MKSDAAFYIKTSLRLWLSCLIEVGLCLPIWIVTAVYLLPDKLTTIIWASGLLLLVFGGVLLQWYLKVVWKRVGAVLLIGGIFGIVVANGTGIPIVWSCLSGTICALQGITVTARHNKYKLYWWGVILYFVSAFLFPRIHELASWMPLLTWVGIATLALTLFVSNEGHLRYSTLSEDAEPVLPGRLRRHNRIYITAIVIAAVVLAAGAGEWISSMLWRMFKSVMSWFPQMPPPAEAQPEEAMPAEGLIEIGGLLEEEVNSPGLLVKILESAMYIMLGLALVGLIAFLIYWLYKNSKFWRNSLHALLGLLRRKRQDDLVTPYQDEEKNIFSWEHVSKMWRDMRNPLSRIGRRTERWEDMSDNRERVRYLYRRLLRSELKEGYQPKPHLTPIEQEHEFTKWLEIGATKATAGKSKSIQKKHRFSTEPLVNLYYRVRYGEISPDDKEVSYIKDKMN